MRKNVASQVIAAQLVSSTDGSDITSGTTTVYVTGDGGTQASGGTATHEGQGCWTFAPSQANTNYDHVCFTFVNTSAISVTVQVYPVSYDPTDSVRLGLTALPNAAAGAAGGLPTDSTGKTSFNDIAATAIVSSGAITTSGGAVSTVSTVTDGATAANLATVDTVVDAIKVKTDFLPSATAGAAGGVFIAGTNAATTITTALTTTVTGNLTGSVGSVTGAVGSVTGAVGSVSGNVDGNVTGTVASVVGNVDGSVASVTGAVGSVTGAVGSVTAEVTADVTKLSGSATAADNLEASALGIIPGTAQTGTLSTTQMTTDLTGFVDDDLIGRVVIFTGGMANGQATAITDYASASGLVTFDTVTTAPVNADTFVIV